MELGYACINTSIDVKVNRTMRKATFNKVGLSGVSELIIKNLNDLLRILNWNHDNDIKLYRMSSSMFPWASEYKLSNLPNFDEVKYLLGVIGRFTKNNNMRLTYHPGQFNILSSNKQSVVRNTIKDLTHHGEVMSLMGLSETHYNKINIHVGAAYNDKESAAKRFIDNFNKLPSFVKSRLTLENEDKLSLFTVKELYDMIYKETKIPIVFDYLHHMCNPGELSEGEALELALSTWPKDIKPIAHYSSSKKLYEDSTQRLLAHADYIYTPIEMYTYDFDIMLESKAKEKAVIRYLKKYNI